MKMIRTVLLVSSMFFQTSHAKVFMNTNQCVELCRIFELGISKGTPTRVYGGLMHIMWRLDTDTGSYAIKQLTEDSDLTDEIVRAKYVVTERIAARFAKQGIPAITALESEGSTLAIIEGKGFFVYPWVEGKVADRTIVSEAHVLKMAEVFAKMHQMRLVVAETTQPTFSDFSTDEIIEYIQKADQGKYVCIDAVKEYQDEIIALNESFHKVIPLLKQVQVISHGDLHAHNVLWDKKRNPFIIDWECAGGVNPTWELLNACFDWSGLEGNFNEDLFIKMAHAYQEAGGIIDKDFLEAAYWGVIGNWLNWLICNVKRSYSLDTFEQRAMALGVVKQTLPLVIKLKALMPHLIKKMAEEL